MKEQNKFFSEIFGMARYTYLNAVLFVLQPPLLINTFLLFRISTQLSSPLSVGRAAAAVVAVPL